MEATFLGVKIDGKNKDEIFREISSSLDGCQDDPLMIVTINPEIILIAGESDEYKKIIDTAGLRVVDGVGISILSKLKGLSVGQRYPGVDLAKDILDEAVARNLRAGLIIRKKGLCTEKQLRLWLRKIYSEKSDGHIDIYSVDNNDLTIDLKPQTGVLLIGTGAPHQERLASEIISKNKDIRIAIGIGGAFDLWTGILPRAPKIFRNLGLEWLWRLSVHPVNRFLPRRILRIFRATVVFTWKVVFG